jgi:tryptophan-rich sensory protein
MGIASYRVWLAGKKGKNVDRALMFYIIQLMLNYLWPIIFFNFGIPGIAFIEIILLLVFIVLTTVKICKADRVSAYLMIPYILWTVFAAVLNFYIWILN